MAKFNVVIRDDRGNTKPGCRVVLVSGETDIADTEGQTIVDNENGSYTSVTDITSGTYTVKYSLPGSTTLKALPGYDSFPFGGGYEGVLPIASGGTGSTTASQARTNLELTPGTDVQGYSARLSQVADLDPPTDGYRFPAISNGGWDALPPADARDALGLGLGDEVQPFSVSLDNFDSCVSSNGSASDHKFLTVSGLVSHLQSAASARTHLGLGSLATESTVPINKGGTGAATASEARAALGLTPLATSNFVNVQNGGTGSTTASQARTNLGLEIGTNVQAHSTALDSIASLCNISAASPKFIVHEDNSIAEKTAAEVKDYLGIGVTPITGGGTDASSPEQARANLGLEIGADIQGWNKYLEAFGAKANGAAHNSHFIIDEDGDVATSSPAEVRSNLGLGTAAQVNYSTNGVNGTVPLFNSGLHLPILSAHPIPSASTVGTLYCRASGTPLSGEFGVYIIAKSAMNSMYTFSAIELYHTAWETGGAPTKTL